MLLEEFEIIKAGYNPQAARMYAKMLENKTPRTLAYGFTTDRETFHAYLAEDGNVVRVIYDHDGLLVDVKSEVDGLLITECVPNKRMYPERCDFEFCQLLMARQVYLPFTMYKMLAQETWYGKKLEDLNTAFKASDFIVSRPVSIDELGLNFTNQVRAELSDLGVRLESLMADHMAGYLRAVQLRADPNAGKWLTNMATVMHHLCLKELELGEELPSALAEKLQALANEAKALCDAKIAELSAKQPA